MTFFHEALFDHAYARSFVAAGASVVALLKSGEQSLFRRTQVRQILAAYRELDIAGSYLRQIHDTLTADGIRYHIRDAVARWIGSLEDPTVSEARMVLALDEGIGPIPNLVFQATASVGWVRSLIAEGAIDRWLDSRDIARRNQALWRLRAVSVLAADEVADTLRKWWTRAPERSREVLSFFQYHDRTRPACFVQLLVDIIRSAPSCLFGQDQDQAELGGYFVLRTKHDTRASAAVLKAWLETWFRCNPDGYPFEDGRVNRNDFYWLRELPKGDPGSFLDAVIPTYREVIARAARCNTQDSHPRLRPFARWRLGSDYGIDGLYGLMLSSVKQIAIADPSNTRRLLEGIDPAAHPSGLQLYLVAVAANGAALHALMPRLLPLDHLFDAGWSGALSRATRSPRVLSMRISTGCGPRQ